MKLDVGHIPSLDGLRAVAVMIVFVAHAGFADLIPGNLGVTVFFFLSGFLITTLLRIEYDRHGRIDLRAFYLRRALRILPPMYIILAIASLLTIAGALEGTIALPALLAQVVHLTNYSVITSGWWDGRAPGTWIYWSLAVEEHFYLVFPLAYVVLRRRVPSPRSQAVVLLVACAVVLLWRFVLIFVFDVAKERTYIATDTRIDSILFGCALAVCANPVLDRVPLSRRVWTRLLAPAGVALIVLSYLPRGAGFEQTLRYSLQGVALVPIFVAATRHPDSPLFAVLNIRAVALMGVISYTIYLVHPTVLFALAQWTPLQGIAYGSVALVATLAIALVMYALVERPCARLRKRLSRTALAPAPVSPEPAASIPEMAAVAG